MHRPFVLALSLVLVACATPATTHGEGDAPAIFHIDPVRPVTELLPIALAATPPIEPGPFTPADLVELTTIDPAIHLDIRYATSRNFLGTLRNHRSDTLSSAQCATRIVAATTTSPRPHPNLGVSA